MSTIQSTKPSSSSSVSSSTSAVTALDMSNEEAVKMLTGLYCRLTSDRKASEDAMLELDTIEPTDAKHAAEMQRLADELDREHQQHTVAINSCWALVASLKLLK